MSAALATFLAVSSPRPPSAAQPLRPGRCPATLVHRRRVLPGYGARANAGTTEEPPTPPGEKPEKPKKPAPPVLGFPNVIFPEDKPWAWQKQEAKASLEDYGQEKSAAGWILNLIELVHWVTLPVGFYIAFFIYSHRDAIAKKLPNGPNGVFFIILGLLCQLFGGAMAIMMHEYEGWQVAPFQNPLSLPEEPRADEVDALRVPEFNNAWLRAVTYHFLFMFQSIGLCLFSAAVFGFTCEARALLTVSTLVALLGPKEPRLELTTDFFFPFLGRLKPARPIFPLAWSLALVFAVNVYVNVRANAFLFSEVLTSAWPPFLSFIPQECGGKLLALAGPLLNGFGGAYEGIAAEGTFWQWHHFIAVVMLLAGSACTWFAYKRLAFA